MFIMNYTEGKGWCAASELKEGDILHTQDGSTETVEKIVIEQLKETVKVYNLEIEGSHTYYVSEDEVLVHNKCQTSGGDESGSKSTTPGFDNWLNKGASDNKVYFGMKDGEPKYTGITKQSKDARLNQHNNAGKGFDDLDIQYDGLTRDQARAIEQYFIENGPNDLNKINSIGQNNKYYKDALEWAKQYLGIKE